MKLSLFAVSMIVVVITDCHDPGKPPDSKTSQPEQQPQATETPLEPRHFNATSIIQNERRVSATCEDTGYHCGYVSLYPGMCLQERFHCKCKKSCKVCDLVPCVDTGNSCGYVTTGFSNQCNSRPYDCTCQKTCGLCSPVSVACVDTGFDCAKAERRKWLCDRDPWSFKCLKTCGKCIPGKECGVVRNRNRIVGGNEAAPHKYPWMATIVYKKYPKFSKCGGSLINKNWILTAAHCFEDGSADELTLNKAAILLGHQNLPANDREAIRFMYYPKRLLMHERYLPKKENFGEHDNDIALLELENTVQITDNISPVCLPAKDEHYYDGTSVTVIGYGYIDLFSGRTSKLMEVNLNTISNVACSKLDTIQPPNGAKPMSYKGITSNQLCTSVEGKDSCEGDSGGPLMTKKGDTRYGQQYVQIGIVSAGPPTESCGQSGTAGVYTRVSKYLDWIVSRIEG